MSVYGILEDIQRGNSQRQWRERMMHRVPEAPVVKRLDYILEQVKGKIVLDVGCAGTNGKAEIFNKIADTATAAFGIDKVDCGLPHTFIFDIEQPWQEMPFREDGIELVVLGEVLEHLANPGRLLCSIGNSMPSADVLITVPNAFSINALKNMQRGHECVNSDHVAWYSWRTLKTLVERFGYYVKDFRWYNGVPLFAEGIIMLCGR